VKRRQDFSISRNFIYKILIFSRKDEMNNSQNSLPELTARLTNELNIPLIITFSVLDVLEKKLACNLPIVRGGLILIIPKSCHGFTRCKEKDKL
jgi:hypothetical protein